MFFFICIYSWEINDSYHCQPNVCLNTWQSKYHTYAGKKKKKKKMMRLMVMTLSSVPTWVTDGKAEAEMHSRWCTGRNLDVLIICNLRAWRCVRGGSHRRENRQIKTRKSQDPIYANVCPTFQWSQVLSCYKRFKLLWAWQLGKRHARKVRNAEVKRCQKSSIANSQLAAARLR